MPNSFPTPGAYQWRTQAAARGRLLYIGRDINTYDMDLGDYALSTFVSADGQAWQRAAGPGPAGEIPDFSPYSVARSEDRWFVTGVWTGLGYVFYRSADI